MTLIAAFELYGVPVLIGDLLMSAPGTERPHDYIPTFSDVSTVLPEDWHSPVTGLSRKTDKINQSLIVGWTGARLSASVALRKLRTEFSLKRTKRDELFQFLSTIEMDQDYPCTLIGWLLDEQGQVSFRWNSSSRELTTNGHPYFEGSGAKDLSALFRDIGYYSTNTGETIASVIQTALALTTNILGWEIFTGETIKQLYGGGVEILYLNTSEFQVVDDISFLYWRLHINDIVVRKQPVLMPFLMNYRYMGDNLVIKSTRLRPNEMVKCEFSIASIEGYVASPIYAIPPKFDFQPVWDKSNSAQHYCHFINITLDKLRGFRCSLVTGGGDNSDFIRFQLLEDKSEMIGWSEKFVQLIYAETILAFSKLEK